MTEGSLISHIEEIFSGMVAIVHTRASTANSIDELLRAATTLTGMVLTYEASQNPCSCKSKINPKLI